MAEEAKVVRGGWIAEDSLKDIQANVKILLKKHNLEAVIIEIYEDNVEIKAEVDWCTEHVTTGSLAHQVWNRFIRKVRGS